MLGKPADWIQPPLREGTADAGRGSFTGGGVLPIDTGSPQEANRKNASLLSASACSQLPPALLEGRT